ncbi:hypothetical protein B4U80_09714 [Leptotrombidium deliense]|uniref:Uncharacterized protein n=1 Tax=Leptotrombidium deliense TaxID=299467 RepID=A0A443SPL1_9ACAR|nr:hypothetical protein B4U80_09714 [Leptotrombidium deliense]
MLSHPFTMIVAGPTSCGKTAWVMKLLKNMLEKNRYKIVYFYSMKQPLYDEISASHPFIKFVKNIDQNIIENHNPCKKAVIVIDDLMSEATNNQYICDLFTKGSHHKNLSVILLLQNFFCKGNFNRTISLNTQYIVLFKNPRDKTIIRYIARQLCPENTSFVNMAYNDATNKPYSYLFIDLKPLTDDRLRYSSNIFEENATPRIVYLNG